MSAADRFTWIRTQDGSPTLWNNELGEPFRSVKGAFRESLLVFAKPAIEFIQKHQLKKVTVGEFGLGAGTNWFIFSSLAEHFEIDVTYYAIEREIEPFNLAMLKWDDETPLLHKLISAEWATPIEMSLAPAELPTIYPAIEDVPADALADIWFHDPFGFSVNPDGYSTELLSQCARVWKPRFLGLSYACNSQFQRDLIQIGVPHVRTIDLHAPPLKKERLEFGSEEFR